MTIVEMCCGTSPGARAAAFLGLNSISFDKRVSQIETSKSLLVDFLSSFKTKPVSNLLKKLFSNLTLKIEY